MMVRFLQNICWILPLIVLEKAEFLRENNVTLNSEQQRGTKQNRCFFLTRARSKRRSTHNRTTLVEFGWKLPLGLQPKLTIVCSFWLHHHWWFLDGFFFQPKKKETSQQIFWNTPKKTTTNIYKYQDFVTATLQSEIRFRSPLSWFLDFLMLHGTLCRGRCTWSDWDPEIAVTCQAFLEVIGDFWWGSRRNKHRVKSIASRELTYPIRSHFWRWFSFSQGGIC